MKNKKNDPDFFGMQAIIWLAVHIVICASHSTDVAKKPLVSIFQVCSGAEHVMYSNMTRSFK